MLGRRAASVLEGILVGLRGPVWATRCTAVVAAAPAVAAVVKIAVPYGKSLFFWTPTREAPWRRRRRRTTTSCICDWAHASVCKQTSKRRRRRFMDKTCKSYNNSLLGSTSRRIALRDDKTDIPIERIFDIVLDLFKRHSLGMEECILQKPRSGKRRARMISVESGGGLVAGVLVTMTRMMPLPLKFKAGLSVPEGEARQKPPGSPRWRLRRRILSHPAQDAATTPPPSFLPRPTLAHSWRSASTGTDRQSCKNPGTFSIVGGPCVEIAGMPLHTKNWN